MEDKALSIDSTKDEVAEFFIKNFKYPNKNKDILIKEAKAQNEIEYVDSIQFEYTIREWIAQPSDGDKLTILSINNSSIYSVCKGSFSTANNSNESLCSKLHFLFLLIKLKV